jgi:cytoskeletal protein CcmA (bactofilin family)
MNAIHETTINLIAEGTRVEGKVTFDHITRVNGTLAGDVHAKDGSSLILSETAVVEGNIRADVVMVDGFVQGDIDAKTKVIVSRTGRVVGNITTPTLVLEFGAYFEGRCFMDGRITADRQLKPA